MVEPKPEERLVKRHKKKSIREESAFVSSRSRFISRADRKDQTTHRRDQKSVRTYTFYSLEKTPEEKYFSLEICVIQNSVILFLPWEEKISL